MIYPPSVLAVGPKGGQIVGYGKGHTPIYLGKPGASSFSVDAGSDSPFKWAKQFNLDAKVHPSRHDMIQVSWGPQQASDAKAWLGMFGGTKGLPAGAEPHRTKNGVVLLVPREWAETASIGTEPSPHVPPLATKPAPKSAPTPAPEPPEPAHEPEAPDAPPGFQAVDKSTLQVWGVKDWKKSARHPVTTPQGDGVLIGQGCGSSDVLNGKLVVEMPNGKQKAFPKAQVTPKHGDVQGCWEHPDAKVWRNDDVSALLDDILTGDIKDQYGNSKGITFVEALDKLGDDGIATYIVGGLVRDAIAGKKGNDVDFTFQGGAQDVRAAAKGANLPMPHYTASGSGNGSGLVQFGHEDASTDEGKLEGKGFGGANTGLGTHMHGSVGGSPKSRGGDAVADLHCRDFTFNALFYDRKNKTVIDPSGTGVQDAIDKVIRPPFPPEKWDEWLENSPQAAVRYFKFVQRGYTPCEGLEEFIVQKAIPVVSSLGPKTKKGWSSYKSLVNAAKAKWS